MDKTLMEPFVKATLYVLETIAFTKVRAGEPYLKTDLVAQGDVSGIIGLTGEGNGTFSISFTETSILAIVSNMFGEEMKEINADIRDAVGEIANMISGQARQKIEEMGKTLKAAIPSVITGKNHIIEHFTTYPITAVPFDTDHGGFTVEVCFED